ncbi:MAG: HYR domain-containing protein, partial [Saprospiraceae bacterium]|nr:HYR domain-containing protein [Saprospiraceae bacterium]
MTQVKKLLLSLLCLTVGQVLLAQTTYSTVRNGNWDVASTWDANGIPPNPIPADATVEIYFSIQDRSGIGLPKTNYGTINVNAQSILIIEDEFDNYGTIDVKGGPTFSEFRVTGTTFNNKVGGVLRTSGNAAYISGSSEPIVNNEAGGLIEIGPDGIWFYRFGTNNRLNNAGSIDNRGLFTCICNFVSTAGSKLYNDNGIIQMTGSIVDIGGEVKLIGDSRFSMETSRLTMQTGSSLEWVLNSQPSGLNYPYIQHFRGIGTFGDVDMKVSLAPGFEPDEGAVYNIFLDSNPVPAGTLSLPALSGVKTWKESRAPDYNGIRIEVENKSCEPTPITCPTDITMDNDDGDCGAIVTFTLPDGATSTPTSGSFFPVGTTTVDVTGSDGCDGTSTCSFKITVNDTEQPSISCPSHTTVGTDEGECGADVHLPAPSADDNCGVTQLKGRYRLVDENNNPLSSYTSRKNDPSDYLAVGRYQVNWRAKDAAGKKRSCSYFLTVEDDEDPTAVCKDVTVEFNGEASIDLAVSQVWNEAASDDNCGTVYYVGTSPSLSISCADLGSVVPLTITIRDEAGNTDNCTADVTVTGLPCGWSEGA